MTPSPARATLLPAVLLAVAGATLVFRLWTSLCFFPLIDWNNVRLAPTFMVWHGAAPYPGLTDGPLTTWIYGPVTLLINLPAVLAPDTATAMLIAGVITLLCAAGPAALAVWAIPDLASAAKSTDRIWAWLLCLALWPNPGLHYIQADNVAVGFGLISNLLLARAPDGLRGAHLIRLLAALCAALAVWSKQTSLGLMLAQALWLGLTVGRRAVLYHTLACAACGLALGAGFGAAFRFDGLWLNLVRLPGQLPFIHDYILRARDLWMQLLGYVVLPAVIVIVCRRTLFRRDSPWLLPVMTWLCLLPTALASAFKLGGASNSLNGILYLFPLASWVVVAWLRRHAPRVAPAWLAAGILTVVLQQLAASPILPLRPRTAQLDSGEALARKFPGQVYFPWHPLLTFYTDHRFYHAEDGLSTRRAAGFAPRAHTLRSDLPPKWAITAIPGFRDYGFFKTLQPPEARLGFMEHWSVYVWPPPPDNTQPQRNRP